VRTDGLPGAGPASPGAARIGGALAAALGGGASTGNDYQLNVMPSRAVRLVLLFCPEGGGRASAAVEPEPTGVIAATASTLMKLLIPSCNSGEASHFKVVARLALW